MSPRVFVVGNNNTGESPSVAFSIAYFIPSASFLFSYLSLAYKLVPESNGNWVVR